MKKPQAKITSARFTGKGKHTKSMLNWKIEKDKKIQRTKLNFEEIFFSLFLQEFHSYSHIS